MSETASQWYMYVVQCSDNSLYCGVTTDLQRRVLEHNTSPRGAKYTKSRRPVVLTYSERHPDRSSALKAEYYFKRLTRAQKVNRISGNN
jgi:putative endonuclease